MSGACRSGRTAGIMNRAKKAKTYADPQVITGSKAGGHAPAGSTRS